MGGRPGAGANPGGSGGAGGRRVSGADIISWTALLTALVVMDAVWFVHRMARTYSTAKMVLYGCPSYIDGKTLLNAGQSRGRVAPDADPGCVARYWPLFHDISNMSFY